MKKVVVFDIDDTFNNFAEVYLTCALEYDKTLRGSGIVSPDKWVSNAFDWNDEEKLEFRKKYRSYVHANAVPKQNALNVLNKIKDKYEIWFLTSRNENDFDLMYDGTYKRLQDHNVPFDKLIINTKKAEFLKDKDNVLLIIDDGFSNCTQIAEACPNIKVYLFTTKNNMNKVTNIPRVNDWYEVEKLFDNL